MRPWFHTLQHNWHAAKQDNSSVCMQITVMACRHFPRKKPQKTHCHLVKGFKLCKLKYGYSRVPYNATHGVSRWCINLLNVRCFADNAPCAACNSHDTDAYICIVMSTDRHPRSFLSWDCACFGNHHYRHPARWQLRDYTDWYEETVSAEQRIGMERLAFLGSRSLNSLKFENIVRYSLFNGGFYVSNKFMV